MSAVSKRFTGAVGTIASSALILGATLVAVFGAWRWRENASQTSAANASPRSTASGQRATAGHAEEADCDVRLPFLQQLVEGTEYEYQLSYSTKGEVAGGRELFALRLNARLTLSRFHDGHDQVLQLRLADVTSDKADQPPAVAALLQRITVPVFGRYHRGGELANVHAAVDTAGDVITLLSYLLAELQLRAPDAAAPAWEAEESDTVGVYTAAYRRRPECRVQRDHVRYSRLHQGAGMTLQQLSHVSTFEFSSEGQLTSFDSRARILQSGLRIGMLGLTEVRARHVRSRSGAVSHLPSGLGTFPIEGGLGSATKQTAPSEPAAQLAARLRTSPGDGEGHFLEKQALADRIRLHPEEIADVLGAVRSAVDRFESSRLIAALTMAGTPEATKAVAALARDSSLEPSLRDQAVTELSLTEHPTLESLGELGALADDASVDPDIRKAALLGVGANLRAAPANITEGQRRPLTSRLEDQATRARSAEERQAALAALGNVGHADHMEALVAGLSSPLAADRATAVFALRHIQTAEAERLILKTMLQDPAGTVRASAAEALANRSPKTELGASTLLDALRREREAPVLRTLVPVLALFLRDFPELRPGVDSLAETTEIAELRSHLRSVLDNSKQGSQPSL
jgi:HEAT repeat protein